jgi:curved DNA-binding protein CbpA
MFKNYYSILNLNKDSFSQELLTRSYRSLVMKYHPDSSRAKDEGTVDVEKFIEITEAYEVLINEKTRLRYDEIYNKKIAEDKEEEIKEEKVRKETRETPASSAEKNPKESEEPDYEEPLEPVEEKVSQKPRESDTEYASFRQEFKVEEMTQEYVKKAFDGFDAMVTALETMDFGEGKPRLENIGSTNAIDSAMDEFARRVRGAKEEGKKESERINKEYQEQVNRNRLAREARKREREKLEISEDKPPVK